MQWETINNNLFKYFSFMKVIPPAVKIKHLCDGLERSELLRITVPLRDNYWLKFHASLLTAHFYIDKVILHV